MLKTNKEQIKGEKGQAIAIVLIFLFLGGTILVTLLTFINNGLKTGQLYNERTRLHYAADAGLEEALWKMDHEENLFQPDDYGASVNFTLPDLVNGKTVSVNMTQQWPLFGLESDENGMVEPACLSITGGIINRTQGKYKVQISYDGTQGDLPIDKIAVWLPTRFQYVAGSSSGISTQTPTISNQRGGKVLAWTFDPPVHFMDLADPAPAGGGFLPGSQYPATRKLYFNVTPTDDFAAGTHCWVRTTDTDAYLAWETGCAILEVSSTATDNLSHKTATLGSATYQSTGVALGEAGVQIRGNYRAIGNSLMQVSAGGDPHVRDFLLTDSESTIDDIPSEGEVVRAYLYWTGFRTVAPVEADRNVGLKINGTSVYYGDEGEPEQGELPCASPTITLRPNATGSSGLSKSGSGGSNYQRVDDITSDNSTTYVYRSGSGSALDLYNITNKGDVVGTVNSVTIFAKARASSTSDMRLQIYCRTHGTNYYATSVTLPSGGAWNTYSKSWLTNPNTGAAWTWQEINDLQIGEKLYDDGTGQAECTQVYTEVNYTVPFEGIEASKWYLMENTGPGYSYSCFKDVTDLVQLVTSSGNATYTVAGVSGNTSEEWSYAGWSLIVFYASPVEQPHQLYLYDNMLYADQNNTDATFTIEGFEAPQDAEATLTCFVGEGDEHYGWPNSGTGYDWLKFNNYYMSDAVNPQYNVWNGISSGMGGVTISGVDIDTFNVSSPIIEARDDSAVVQLHTGTDAWNLIYILLSFRSEYGGLTPNATGIISYTYGPP
jgi:hypothetical protein